ncbi:MAG: hydrogenase maturation nickel metallochaperone HypA [Deltaproteobacteria bacterium]|nr:hydrogenase maturation nickel metallochaperone HypA [Deltaproteobacteria bacterium]
MHEMSLAVALMEEINAIASQNQVERIQEVELHIGVLKQVVPVVMQEAFNAASIGTPAEGALLKQVAIDAQASCRSCKNIFTPEPDNFLCPVCGQGLIDILKGEEFILQSLTCES